PPTPISRASSGASRRGSIRRSPRSPRCSSAAGTSRAPARCRPTWRTGWASPAAGAPTRATRSRAAPRASRASPTPPAPRRRAQRLLWASTGTKDPKASDILYIKAFAAPFTVNTMPEGTLKALHEHGEVGEPMARDGGDCEAVLASFGKAGIDVDALAHRLQDEGAASFVQSWNELMDLVATKSTSLRKAS